MAATAMQLEVVTPEGQKISVQAKDVTCPGVMGELDILPGHVPVLTVLDIGELKFVETDGTMHRVAINGGFLEVEQDRLLVITETAEIDSDIDVERARAAWEKAAARMATQEEGSTAFAQARRAQKRAQTRLRVAGSDEQK